MRIIAGAWRGRPIDAPPAGTRPTADRIRESLFSMLASRLGSFEGLRVADLFAGSGALGLEALSRGAAEALFVESDFRAAEVIRANIQRLGCGDRARVTAGSALALPKSEPFDLVFADPPYGPGSGSQAVASACASGWVAPGSWMAVETERGDAVDPGPMAIDAEREAGRARLSLLRF